MKVFALLFFLTFGNFTHGGEVEFLEKRVYDYCPLSIVCGLVIDHYLTDQVMRVNYTGLLDNAKAEKAIVDEGYRLDGFINLASNYSVTSQENVITFYDGVGVSSAGREAELINTYTLGVRYDLELASQKKRRVQNEILQKSIDIKMSLFNSVNDLFPPFIRTESSSNLRNLFQLVASVMKQSLYKKVLGIYKKAYLKQVNLYKNKVINLEVLEKTNSLIGNYSDLLFREISFQDIMFPGEIKFKKRIINLALNIYKKIDSIIIDFLQNKDVKICSQLSSIEEKEKRERWTVSNRYDQILDRFQFQNSNNANALNLNVTGNINEPSQANLTVGYNVSVRIFDGYNYQLGKAMYRLSQRNLRFKFEDLKFNESIRVSLENTRVQDAIQFYENVQLTYNRFKVNNKFQMKGSFLDDSLVIKDMNMLKRMKLISRIVDNEAKMIVAKAIMASSIFRINTVCHMIDIIHKDYLE